MAVDGVIEIRDRESFPQKTKAIKDAAAELRAARDELGTIVDTARKEAGSFTVDGQPAPVYSPVLDGLKKWLDATSAVVNSVADSADACADTAHDKFVGITETDDEGADKIKKL
ncbi:hypothetical protein H7J07_05530 [Mycobacterium koreense]|uniref:hypothetical protein n=1 Tax=Mycolicibacillus koreensis TaxID=1069220 RepID=UPI0010556FF7|nr:hypothetical protein [Mycolicibacillus koreensis]MCV7247685.1 hypothetical protein [Mycolicibacillus koreensis]BBY54070.1 hypothetical protein MKOR_13210 [Mycolicibacillus koreensis]